MSSWGAYMRLLPSRLERQGKTLNTFWTGAAVQEEPKEGDAAAMDTDAAEPEIGPQPAPEGGEPMQEE